MNLKSSHLRHAAVAAAMGLGMGAAHAQVAARDAASAELRAPTADEAQALSSVGATSKASRPVGLLSGKSNLQPVRYADGTVSQELDTSTLMYSVARRNADGSISMYCVTGSEAADQLVNAKQGAQVAAKTSKEHQHDVK